MKAAQLLVLIAVGTISVLGAPTLAEASDWALIRAQRSPDNLFFLHRDSVQTVGSARIFNILRVMPERRVEGGVAFDYSFLRVSIDCDANTVSSQTFVSFRVGEDGAAANYDLDMVARAISPDSLAAAASEYVCGRVPPERFPGVTGLEAKDLVTRLRENWARLME